MTTDSPEGLLREIAERDPEAHNRALACGYGCGVDSSDTAIGSPAFKAAKEAAQARGWVMEPSVISGMLAAAFGSLLERLDQLEHRLYPSQGENFDNEVERRGYVIETMQGAIAELRAELAAAQARAESAEQTITDVATLTAKYQIPRRGGSFTQGWNAALTEMRAALAGDAVHGLLPASHGPLNVSE